MVILDNETIKFIKKEPSCEDAQVLLNELNEVLIGILGHNGMMYVNFEDFSHDRAGFYVGYIDDSPICCAGIRYENDTTCEFKRVYARKNDIGLGRKLISFLENESINFGYKRIILECRDKNKHAIEFYQNNGYCICENYPPYDKEYDAVCLHKYL